MSDNQKTLESVQEYYGRVLKGSKDLKTSACCTTDSLPRHLREALKLIHPEVQERFYGCGSPIPSVLEGKTVLDLGCGSGRDSYLISKLVGPAGRVIGVDMTDGQLEIAKRHLHHHADRFGYSKTNVEFRKGYIEDLESLGIQNGSVDVVISNCVINLSPDKHRVFSEIFRVLKPGGELFFSDIFADRRVPPNLGQDPVLLGECLGGALYIEDFRRLLLSVGCPDYRIVSQSRVDLKSDEVRQKGGNIGFHSLTLRAFKLSLEDRCEDFGQVAYYQGTIPEHPHQFLLDDHHLFKTGMPVLVCGNTASMLSETRYREHFRITGDRSTHFGLFDCGPEPALAAGKQGPASLGGCC